MQGREVLHVNRSYRNTRRLRPRLLIRYDTSIAICEPLRCSDAVTTYMYLITTYMYLMHGHEIFANRSKTYMPALSRPHFAQRKSRIWRQREMFLYICV